MVNTLTENHYPQGRFNVCNVINWNSEHPFGSSTLKSKLDTLMMTLNAVHPKDVFEYSFHENTLTIYQRDGGEIILGGYVSGDTKRKLTAELIPAPGQGDSTHLVSTLIQLLNLQLQRLPHSKP